MIAARRGPTVPDFSVARFLLNACRAIERTGATFADNSCYVSCQRYRHITFDFAQRYALRRPRLYRFHAPGSMT